MTSSRYLKVTAGSGALARSTTRSDAASHANTPARPLSSSSPRCYIASSVMGTLPHSILGHGYVASLGTNSLALVPSLSIYIVVSSPGVCCLYMLKEVCRFAWLQ